MRSIAVPALLGALALAALQWSWAGALAPIPLVCVFLGLATLGGVLRQCFPVGIAVGAMLLAVAGTPVLWHLAHAPSARHALGFLLGAAILALAWPAETDARRTVAAGALAGAAAAIEPAAAALMVLPASGLMRRGTGDFGSVSREAFALVLPFTAVGLLVGWSLGSSVEGASAWSRLGAHPILDGLFSSRHGVLFWTPLSSAALAGLALLVRSTPRALAGLVTLLVLVLLSAAWAGDGPGGVWAAGRLAPGLPLAALGVAGLLSQVHGAARRHPGRVLGAGGLCLLVWNHLFMEQYRRDWIPRDDTVAFSRVAGHSARLIAESVGTPLAWPANWLFARRHGLPPSRYDDMVGRDLFEGPGAWGGILDVGELPRGEGPLAEGWSNRQACDAGRCRDVRGSARLFVPLNTPQDLTLTLRAQGTGALELALNGARIGEWSLGGPVRPLQVRIPQARWRRGLNELRFVADPEGRARVDRLVFRPVVPGSD